MKLFTILRNLIQGIQNAKTYTDDTFSQLADYVIEQSNIKNADGYPHGYTKWASGKLECWTGAIRSVATNTSWQGRYYGTASNIPFPIEFVDVPDTFITLRSGSAWLMNGYSTKSGTGPIYPIRPYSASAENFGFTVYAIGKMTELQGAWIKLAKRGRLQESSWVRSWIKVPLKLIFDTLTRFDTKILFSQYMHVEIMSY